MKEYEVSVRSFYMENSKALNIDIDTCRYHAMIGTGGIGTGMFFVLNDNPTLGREESRSGHFREDFPQRDDKNWFKWIKIEQKGGEASLATLPIPIDKYKLQP